MAEKKKILYIVEAMGGGVFTYIVDLANTVGIGKQREVVLFLIKHRMYLMLDMMGKIRKWQKEHR